MPEACVGEQEGLGVGVWEWGIEVGIEKEIRATVATRPHSTTLDVVDFNHWRMRPKGVPKANGSLNDTCN